MNRPLWLDTLRVWAFLAPPIIMAGVVASVVTLHFGWSFWAFLCVELVAAVPLVAAWITFFVLLSPAQSTTKLPDRVPQRTQSAPTLSDTMEPPLRGSSR
jgi:hypothetical protein